MQDTTTSRSALLFAPICITGPFDHDHLPGYPALPNCSETGTRLPALREWPADEVYPVSPASLMGLGLLPITISVVGLALLAIWLVLLARGTSSRHQQAETS